MENTEQTTRSDISFYVPSAAHPHISADSQSLSLPPLCSILSPSAHFFFFKMTYSSKLTKLTSESTEMKNKLDCVPDLCLKIAC